MDGFGILVFQIPQEGNPVNSEENLYYYFIVKFGFLSFLYTYEYPSWFYKNIPNCAIQLTRSNGFLFKIQMIKSAFLTIVGHSVHLSLGY